jgi:regulator of sigma E protease
MSLVALLTWLASTATTVLLFVAILGLLIFVHELGHFLAAKSVGVTVEEFAFGFGPKLLTLMKRGGTEYTVRALPLGGFVSMIGMQPEDVDVPDGLMSKPAWARAWVFLAGPLMNVVLAVLVLCSMGMITGVPDFRKSTTQVVDVVKHSEAARVGIREGDVVVAIDGVPMRNGDQLIKVIRSHPGQQIQLTLRRSLDTFTVAATPRPTPLDSDPKQIIGRLGFSPSPTFERVGFRKSVTEGFNSIRGFFAFFQSMFRHPKTLRDSAGGPIQIFSETNKSKKLPLGYMYSMLGSLSLSLAVFNLLPIPVLDGGHLAILVVDCFSGLFLRRRLTPEVHRVATMIGLVFIGTIFLLLAYSDLMKVFKG